MTFITIMPLGGVKEIGSNMTLVQTKKETILIDAGILFPAENHYNIQYIVPNISVLKKNPPRSLFITHAHEDHIGAVPFILKTFPHLTIYASPLAQELILHKLSFIEGAKIPKFKTLKHLTHVALHDIDLTPFLTNHSIPETFGITIQDKKKHFSITYLSDFKYDRDSYYEPRMDLTALRKLTQRSSQRIVMLDSTNILEKGKTPSEKQLIRPLQKIISNHKDRIFITLFPSNIYRLQTFIDLAIKQDKKLVCLGRSLITYITIATKLKLLKNLKKVYLLPEEISKDDKNLMILVTGCQGDMRSALDRITAGHDTLFKIRVNDLFVFSSKTIPGNEKKVSKIINRIYGQGGKVVTSKDELIHTSGHAGQEDLKMVMKKLAPTDFIPIHGETYFLHKHVDFVKQNFPRVKCHLLKNFDSITFEKRQTFFKRGKDLAPILFLSNHCPIEKRDLSHKRKMALNGIVFLSVTESPQANEITLRFDFKGLPDLLKKETRHLHELVMQEFRVNEEFISLSNSEKEEHLRILIRRHFFGATRMKPLAIVHLL